MPDFAPGDRLLIRISDSFFIAKVDLVKPTHLTCFLFDPAHQRWQTGRRRILRSAVVERQTASFTSTGHLVRRMTALQNQRDAARRTADRQLEQSLRQLVAEKEDA